MVVFTCNACGESLRKPQVEKHYKFQCRRCEVLSCIDCGKDFPGDSYLTHTSCISEAEKYQKADYKPKPSANKGMHKQNSWVATVESAVERARANGASRMAIELLERIKSFDNVPQKEPKFINFVKSSAGIRDPKIASEAFQQLRATFTANKDAVKETEATATPTDAMEKLPKVEQSAVEQEVLVKKEQTETPASDVEAADRKPKKRKFDFINETASYMQKRQKSELHLNVLEKKMYKVYKKAAAVGNDPPVEETVLLDADKFSRKLGNKLRSSEFFKISDELMVALADDDNDNAATVDPHENGGDKSATAL